ncbi:serine/threonine protein kinase [Mycolicibacterium sp. P9-64]|uniref:serine/threonine-protein kinase n=1 Tax=Mycolicibacterium sp. P9-64 TaxID=2024612 RepID=UPI0011ED47B1|nr:serine/threonine-protein kinase [Mycolicibacterium sp. P9-64]KAA0075791.1 serine/threonine protein kinase [Mycolicibacterium sp. P9-64]
MSTPTRLGDRYELRGVLGRGGMAEVRDGWDTRLGRAVAIKLLHPGFSRDPDSRLRFRAEARSAASLTHPNIVAVHDYGEHEGTPYIVMERLPGRTLDDEMASSPMSQSRVRFVLDNVLSALAAAHGAGVLHRDIKPGNILLTAQGTVKVADFGIAKTNANAYTQTGQIVGTLAYLSPDRLAGKPAAVTDDLYALGCLGYEALSGRRPFPQEELGPLTRAILDDTPTSLLALRPAADPTVAAVIERALARDPRQRFVSAEDMRMSLWNTAAASYSPATGRRPPTRMLTAAFPASSPPSAYIPSHASTPPRHRIGRLPAVGGIVAALTLVAAVLVFNAPFRSDPRETPPSTSSSTPPATPTASSATTTTTTTTSPEGPPGGGDHKGGKGKGRGKH